MPIPVDRLPDRGPRARDRRAASARHTGPAALAHYLDMDSNNALDAILALRAIWEQKRGRVTLADLEILVHRRVRTRGAAALPPERWRGRPWRATTRHEVVFEA